MCKIHLREVLADDTKFPTLQEQLQMTDRKALPSTLLSGPRPISVARTCNPDSKIEFLTIASCISEQVAILTSAS